MFFFNDSATTEIYTLSLHDALPISDLETLLPGSGLEGVDGVHESYHTGLDGHYHRVSPGPAPEVLDASQDRKSTRLNSSHANISYAVFCLKKKNFQTHLLSYLSACL